MQDADLYQKTDAGRDEIKSRARGLTMAARAILLMVDGQRNVASLRAVIAGSKAPGDTLDSLANLGLIEVKPVAGAAPALSIGTPRVATMGRPEPAPTPAPPPARPASTIANPAAPSIDGPLDLTLPTIYGSDEWSAPAQPPAAAAPSAAPGGAKDRYERLYQMINDVVRDFLPAHRRYMIQLKIERAGTAEELIELLDSIRTALAKSKGDEFASSVIARLRAAAG